MLDRLYDYAGDLPREHGDLLAVEPSIHVCLEDVFPSGDVPQHEVFLPFVVRICVNGGVRRCVPPALIGSIAAVEGERVLGDGSALAASQETHYRAVVWYRAQPELRVPGVLVAVPTHPNLEVQMRADGDASHAHLANEVALIDLLQEADMHFGEVPVEDVDFLVTIQFVQLDDHQLTVEVDPFAAHDSVVCAGNQDSSWGRGEDRSGKRIREVRTAMDAVLALGSGAIGIRMLGLVSTTIPERAAQPKMRLRFDHRRPRSLGGSRRRKRREGQRGGQGVRRSWGLCGGGLENSSERARGPPGDDRNGKQTGQRDGAGQEGEGQLHSFGVSLVMGPGHGQIIAQPRDGKP